MSHLVKLSYNLQKLAALSHNYVNTRWLVKSCFCKGREKGNLWLFGCCMFHYVWRRRSEKPKQWAEEMVGGSVTSVCGELWVWRRLRQSFTTLRHTDGYSFMSVSALLKCENECCLHAEQMSCTRSCRCITWVTHTHTVYRSSYLCRALVRWTSDPQHSYKRGESGRG